MVGLIAFANDSGLGIQTKRLYEMLKPDKVMVIDSRGFSKNKQFHEDWYPGAYVTDGFPRNYDIIEWIKGLDVVFTVENPYNFYLIHACRERGIKTICQTNYEFCENLAAPWLPVPDLFAMPSYWKLREMKDQFGEDRVMYLPPPIDEDEFTDVFLENEQREILKPKRKKRFLHIVGTLAHADRNGTIDLLNSVRETKEDFELVIHTQHQLPAQYLFDDKRVIYRQLNFKENAKLYLGFDALILPRRYGGLSLTTNEALMAGLPVMMPHISPNHELLPHSWLVPVSNKELIQIRVPIDRYTTRQHHLAQKIDEWAVQTPSPIVARNLGIQNFSSRLLESRYRTVLR